tara:strand:+ start:18789 stop:19253 length:465 start_codon:yes stop_codon:yes gene_type:complete
MAAPTNTYNSPTSLNLGQVPNDIEDESVYIALLDIHNAIEAILTSTDAGDTTFQAYLSKKRNVTEISASYTVATTDGEIRVDASGGSITITLPPVAGIKGYEFTIKRVDSVVTANTVTIIGTGAELIDGHVGGIDVYLLSSYTVKATTSGWDII